MKKKMINSMLLSGVLFCCFLLVMCKSTKETTTQVETTTQIAEPATPVALAQETKLVTADTAKVEAPPQIVAENFIDSLNSGLIRYSLEGVYHYIDPIDKIPFILEQVFPNVIFYHSKTNYDPTPVLCAYYENITYTVASEFNNLYTIAGNKAVSFNNRIEALIQAIVGTSNVIKIDTVEEISQKVYPMPFEFNLKATGQSDNQKITFLILFEKDTFVCITEIKGHYITNTFYYR